MIWASVYYLGASALMLAVFAAIVAKTCRKSEKDRLEQPKYRMMQDD